MISVKYNLRENCAKLSNIFLLVDIRQWMSLDVVANHFNGTLFPVVGEVMKGSCWIEFVIKIISNILFKKILHYTEITLPIPAVHVTKVFCCKQFSKMISL